MNTTPVLLKMCEVMAEAFCKELGVAQSRYMTVGLLLGVASADTDIAKQIKNADDALREYLTGGK